MTSQPDTIEDPRELEEFIARCEQGLRHQVRGDSAPFLDMWSKADDVTILGAIGSYARGWQDVKTHLLAAARTLQWTSVSVERLTTIEADGIAVAVALEHMARDAGGEGDHRTLRVTHAYRQENGNWRLVMRHANLVTAEDQAREREILGGDR